MPTPRKTVKPPARRTAVALKKKPVPKSIPGLSAKAALRNQLRHRRAVIPADLRHTTQWKVQNLLRTLIADLAPTVVALYSPRECELDLTPLAAELWRDGQTVALPRVVQRGHPLTFNIWPPFGALEPDALGISAALGAEILPSVVVLPCVGYSRGGYRLGSGGGYYDRTLAAFRHPCRTVGVAFTELELPKSYRPQRHDMPLDFIVTGREVIVPTPPPTPRPKLAKVAKRR